jgi:ATPase subunit of ABC transporter with duplicated ATPase domains
MKEMASSVRKKYSNISLADLEQKVTDISNENNLVGEKITRARLQGQGDTIQRSRTSQAIQNTVGPRPRPPRLTRREYSYLEVFALNQTEIVDNSVTLSGGQKARVSLA